MEETNARVMENEELDEIATEVDDVSESGNAGALVAGIAGGFLAYAMIGGAKKLWRIIGTKVAEYKAAQKDQIEAVDAEYTEVNDAEDSDKESSEK